jgi:hypothetical protein
LSKHEPDAFGLVHRQRTDRYGTLIQALYAFTLREKNKPHCLTQSSGMAAFSFRALTAWAVRTARIRSHTGWQMVWLKCCSREELQQFGWGRIHQHEHPRCVCADE